MPAQFVVQISGQPTRYGQVEPNHLSGLSAATAISQAPAYTDATATTPIPVLENGMILKVIPDTVGVSPMGYIAVLPGAAPATAKAYMVYSEKKIYDERLGYSNYADLASDKVDGVLYPRLIALTPDSDFFTTNCLEIATDATVQVGKIFGVQNTGYIGDTAVQQIDTTLEFQAVKDYTMPDLTRGIKLIVKIKGAH